MIKEMEEAFSQSIEGKEAARQHLTGREREVLVRLFQGKTNKEIARELAISPKTVSVHRSSIMAKLGVHNSVELVRCVMENNLLEDT